MDDEDEIRELLRAAEDQAPAAPEAFRELLLRDLLPGAQRRADHPGGTPGRRPGEARARA
jgi:hypothetical protein